MKDKYDNLINEFVIFEKRYLLYSHGHEFLDQAAVGLIKTINELHKITPKIRITALGNNMVINDVEYDEENSRAAYLAELLSDRGVFSISLNSGVELDSILDFLHLLNTIPKKSKLLYHPEIQEDMNNINFIDIEEMDYTSIGYGYEDEINFTDVVLSKNQLHEALKSLYPRIDSMKKNELIVMAIEEISKMSPEEVSDYLLGLSDDVVSAILKRLKAKEDSDSPSLIDLLEVLDSKEEIEDDYTIDKFNDEMVDNQAEKLIERGVYELLVSEDYSHHLQSQLGLDVQSLEKFDTVDLFDNVLISKTIVKALIHLTKNELHTDFHDSFIKTIYSYIDELLEKGDWNFIHSILDGELVSSYLKQNPAVDKLSEGIRKNNSYDDNYVLEILKVSGPKNVNWLMDVYLEEPDEETRSSILKLIFLFGEAASVKSINKIIVDPEINISLLMPIIENNFETIPKVLLLQLLAIDLANIKLLAIKILLKQNDDKVTNYIEEIHQNGEDNLVIGLLDFIKEYKITELSEALMGKIKTLYINEDKLKYILKTIDIISSIDNQA